MKTRIILFLVFAILLFSLGLLLTVVFNSLPSNPRTLLLFYGSYLLTLIGVIFYANYLITSFNGRWQGSYYQTILGQLRTAVIASVTLTIITLLQASRLLNAATFLVLVFVGIVCNLMLKRRSVPKL